MCNKSRLWLCGGGGGGFVTKRRGCSQNGAGCEDILCVFIDFICVLFVSQFVRYRLLRSNF